MTRVDDLLEACGAKIETLRIRFYDLEPDGSRVLEGGDFTIQILLPIGRILRTRRAVALQRRRRHK